MVRLQLLMCRAYLLPSCMPYSLERDIYETGRRLMKRKVAMDSILEPPACVHGYIGYALKRVRERQNVLPTRGNMWLTEWLLYMNTRENNFSCPVMRTHVRATRTPSVGARGEDPQGDCKRK